MTQRWRLITNIILFQSVWWLAFVFQHQALLPMVGIIALMLYLSDCKKRDALLLLTLPLAIFLEWVATQLSLLSFGSESMSVPLWLIALWAALLLTINHSLAFLSRIKPIWCLLACFVLAPPSYLGAARFEVISIDTDVVTFYLAYGLMWALTFTGIILINNKVAHVLTLKQ